MKYFIGNKDGMDYVYHIENSYKDVDTGAVEGERSERLYYFSRLSKPRTTTFGHVYTKKLSYCNKKSLKAMLIMMFGTKIDLSK